MGLMLLILSCKLTRLLSLDELRDPVVLPDKESVQSDETGHLSGAAVSGSEKSVN